MSQSPLSSFDPFAAHPFTSLKAASIPVPPPPSQYAHPIPTSHTTSSHAPAQPSSLPNSQTPSPLTAPKAQRPAPPSSSSSKSTSKSSSKGIFVTFTPERRPTPDLEDILAKKNGLQTWGKK